MNADLIQTWRTGSSAPSNAATQPAVESCGRPTSRSGTPGTEADNDRVGALKVIGWFIATTTTRRYDILDRRVFDGGFVQQHVLHADGANGAAIALRVCIVIKVNATGFIVRIDEYFDPADMAPLLT